MRELGTAELGASTFCASSEHHDQCGANGLPLTPNSVKILGRFQQLQSLDHPSLCAYVHIQRSKHERLILVAEHYKNNLAVKMNAWEFSDAETLTQLAYDILSGLEYLHTNKMVHRCLEPKCIEFNAQGRAMLSNYGLYFMTEYGADVTFPIGNVTYLPPEVLLLSPKVEHHVIPAAEDFGRGPGTTCPVSCKVDTWSLGMILLEVAMGRRLWENQTTQRICLEILQLAQISSSHPVDIILSAHNSKDTFLELPEHLQSLIRDCLTLQTSQRPSVNELLNRPVFDAFKANEPKNRNGFYMFSTELRCKDLELPTNEEFCEDFLSERAIGEVFYWWQLAGGDLEAVLKKAGMMRTKPPVTKFVNFVLDSGEAFGQVRDRALLYDDTITILPMTQLRERLENIEYAAYYPIIESEFSPITKSPTKLENAMTHSDSSSHLQSFNTIDLPLVIREKDVEYQFERVVLYERLLKAYPYMKARIEREARTDITPLFRAQTWAALLAVQGDVRGRYFDLDKETLTSTDRQIEVDIPRCHQYNELLSSPEGHRKLKRILKAWVVSHPEYVYWQGLDSLCAPFLHVSFNDEALAFACLDNFIPKYLHKFFLKDNSAIIQEYLAVFGQLIAFHDAELSCHLTEIGFIPDLYAIPWFLTMFAHAFPMHKLFHLWDTLLLGDSSFPLYIGVAILLQLREALISAGFNECILLFSDMPDIDIQKCVRDSIRLFRSTPKSASFRRHSRPEDSEHVDTKILAEIPLQDVRNQPCPHITAQDLLTLTDLAIPRPPDTPPNAVSISTPATTTNGTPIASPVKARNKNARSKILIIDIRATEDFQRGTIPGSVNLPSNTAFNAEGQFVTSQASQVVMNSRSLVKVIVGNRGNPGMQFAEKLLQKGVNKLCVLYKGIDSVRHHNVLIVPSI